MFFWYFSYVISVQLAFHICIFYTVVQIPSSLATSFINGNITNVLLSISCGLEAVDQRVEYSLILTFWLLRQILQYFGYLFYGKKALGISNFQLNSDYFLSPMTVRVIGSPLEIHLKVLVFSLTGKTVLTSLIDYFSK